MTICHLLISLQKSYEAFVAALETMKASQLKLEFVKARLLDESNERRNTGSSRANVNSNAFMAQNSFVTQNSFNYKFHNCGRSVHKRSECRVKPSFNKNNLPGSSGMNYSNYNSHSN